MQLRPLLTLLASTMLAAAVHAQVILPDVNGRWSTGDCATSYYDWSLNGDSIRFRDNRNRTYAERIIAGGRDGFTTMEAAGSSGRPPAQWAYRLLGPDTISILNLSTGRGFTQHRCAATAASIAPPLNSSPPQLNQLPSRLGYSVALGVDVFASGRDWCAPTVTLRVVARNQRTFSDPALAILLQRLSQTVLTPSCPVAATARFEGSIGDRPNGWQRTAAAASGWALATEPAQQPGGGVDLDAAQAAPSNQPSVPSPLAQVTPPGPAPNVLRVRPSFSLPGRVPPDSGAPPTAGPNVPSSQSATQSALPGTLRPAQRPTTSAVPTALASDSEQDADTSASLQACPAIYPGTENARIPLLCSCDASALVGGTVIGTSVYGFGSAICRAARHAGIIGAEGGDALFIPLPGSTNLVASDRNGVSSGSGQGASFRPYRPTVALTDYYRRWLALDRQIAHSNSVRTADGRVLTPSATFPPLPLSLTPMQPVAGTVLAMPGMNQMSLPVPPPPLSSAGLSPTPWTERF